MLIAKTIIDAPFHVMLLASHRFLEAEKYSYFVSSMDTYEVYVIQEKMTNKVRSSVLFNWKRMDIRNSLESNTQFSRLRYDILPQPERSLYRTKKSLYRQKEYVTYDSCIYRSKLYNILM